MVFEAGYSSASIAERLYVSSDSVAPMAGILLYTAAGDSEGTLGGLVSLGKPDRFSTILSRALQRAQWCSADPICMESSERGGQGPRSTNYAACHGCALLPETACENGNHLLDRTVLIGKPGQEGLGFFSSP